MYQGGNEGSSAPHASCCIRLAHLFSVSLSWQSRTLRLDAMPPWGCTPFSMWHNAASRKITRKPVSNTLSNSTDPPRETDQMSPPPEAIIIIEFLREQGFEVREDVLSSESFLPGIAIVEGALVVDWAGSPSPGDLLHEAGHLALLPPVQRRAASSSLTTMGICRCARLSLAIWVS